MSFAAEIELAVILVVTAAIAQKKEAKKQAALAAELSFQNAMIWYGWYRNSP